jgi:hypothetical protein
LKPTKKRPNLKLLRRRLQIPDLPAGDAGILVLVLVLGIDHPNPNESIVLVLDPLASVAFESLLSRTNLFFLSVLLRQ